MLRGACVLSLCGTLNTGFHKMIIWWVELVIHLSVWWKITMISLDIVVDIGSPVVLVVCSWTSVSFVVDVGSPVILVSPTSVSFLSVSVAVWWKMILYLTWCLSRYWITCSSGMFNSCFIFFCFCSFIVCGEWCVLIFAYRMSWRQGN